MATILVPLAAIWHLGACCMNFHSRVTLSSPRSCSHGHTSSPHGELGTLDLAAHLSGCCRGFIFWTVPQCHGCKRIAAP